MENVLKLNPKTPHVEEDLIRSHVVELAKIGTFVRDNHESDLYKFFEMVENYVGEKKEIIKPKEKTYSDSVDDVWEGSNSEIINDFSEIINDFSENTNDISENTNDISENEKKIRYKDTSGECYRLLQESNVLDKLDITEYEDKNTRFVKKSDEYDIIAPTFYQFFDTIKEDTSTIVKMKYEAGLNILRALISENGEATQLKIAEIIFNLQKVESIHIYWVNRFYENLREFTIKKEFETEYENGKKVKKIKTYKKYPMVVSKLVDNDPLNYPENYIDTRENLKYSKKTINKINPNKKLFLHPEFLKKLNMYFDDINVKEKLL